MNTFLGISAVLAPEDIDEGLVASAAITYCEGYLYDTDVAKAAIRRAMDVASEGGTHRVDDSVGFVLCRSSSP